MFNKVKIKIAHSHEEIDQYYSGNVTDILHECLDYLPRTEDIIQGDFIGFGGDTEYTPNTLTYKFVDVVSQRIIIAPHTVYIAEYDLRDSRAFPLTINLDSDDDVKFVQPSAYILFDADTFDVDEVCAFAKQMSTACTFVSDKELPYLKKQINDCIREQLPVVS